MKIVLINNLFGEYARGGAERVVAAIADRLIQAGHKVMIIASKPLSESKKILNIKYLPAGRQGLILNIYFWNLISYYNLHKLPKLLRLLWHIIDMFNVQSYFKIKKILQTEKPDLVITHNLMGVGFLTPLAIKHYGVKTASTGLRRVKHIHTLHDIQLLHPSGLMFVGQENKVNSLSARVYQWVNKKLFSSVNIIISPSQWLMDMHVKKNFFVNSKKVVISNPVMQNEECTRLPTRQGMKNAECKNSQGKFIFLYVGQVEKHKGVELLLEAFVDLKDNKYELWIVGEGSKNKMTNDECRMTNINEKTKFFGKKNSTEVRELMRKADCLVVPSLCYENQPTVITEARQNDLPVIAANIGGIPEILDREFLFKAGKN